MHQNRETMRKILLFIAVGFTIFYGCKEKQTNQQLDLAKHVNPFIGTTREGNQNPGAHYPFGMVFPSPVNKGDTTIGVTNYEYGEPYMHGFALTTMVGTGCSIYGSVLLMPQTKEIDLKHSSVAYNDEKAEAGYYAANLANKVKVELTSATRSGMMRMIFPKGKGNILIDMSRINTQDTAFVIEKHGANEVTGYRTDGQFAGKPGVHKMYFVIRCEASENTGLIRNNMPVEDKRLHVSKEPIGAYFSKECADDDTVCVSFGVSYVSVDNARENMEHELQDKTFQTIVNENRAAWNNYFNKVIAEGGSDEDMIKFYTAFYHTMSHPHILSDVNGEYPAMETLETKKVAGRNRYTLFSLWDTYRTLHPLFTLVYPNIQSDMIKSMMDMYREYGYLPHWELNSIEKGVMNGDPAVIVINDSYQKGIRDFDTLEALEAMVHQAKEYYVADEADRKNVQYIRKALDPYKQYGGYIPHDYKEAGNDVWGIVATTLEYNLADWNIAQYAKDMGKQDIYQRFIEWSGGWKFFYDEETGFLRSRYADSTWLEPFSPFNEFNEMSWKHSGGPGFTEGYAWHYNYFVPHDINELMEIMGGSEPFVNRLQTMFDSGYYRPTNEPDIAFPFLFNYVDGEAWRTQKVVRDLLKKEFGTGPAGIPGNDDTGTMSAWAIFAMMGFYPDCPGDVHYQICSPVFDKITIKLNEEYYQGKKFIIEVKNKHDNNKYIQSLTINGEPCKSFSIEHKCITEGGRLVVTLGKNRKQ